MRTEARKGDRGKRRAYPAPPKGKGCKYLRVVKRGAGVAPVPLSHRCDDPRNSAAKGNGGRVCASRAWSRWILALDQSSGKIRGRTGRAGDRWSGRDDSLRG